MHCLSAFNEYAEPLEKAHFRLLNNTAVYEALVLGFVWAVFLPLTLDQRNHLYTHFRQKKWSANSMHQMAYVTPHWKSEGKQVVNLSTNTAMLLWTWDTLRDILVPVFLSEKERRRATQSLSWRFLPSNIDSCATGSNNCWFKENWSNW